MKKWLGLLLAVMVLGGCQTVGGKITRINPGAGSDAVVALLGRPDALHVSGDYRIYTYLHRRRTPFSLHHTDYTVIVKGGRVVQYGPGHARREGIHSWTIVPPVN